MLGLRRRRRLLQPRPRLGVDLQEPNRTDPDPPQVKRKRSYRIYSRARPSKWSEPEDGADEAAGVVRPEVRVGGAVRAAGGAAAGAAGALVVGVVGGGGAEEDGLVDLGLAERERQQGPRRVALRRRQRRRHRFGRADEQSASSCWVSGGRLLRDEETLGWSLHLDGAGGFYMLRSFLPARDGQISGEVVEFFQERPS